MDKTVLLTVGIMAGTAVLMNLIFLAIIYSMHRKAKAIEEWSTTTGTVLTSGLERRRSSSNSGGSTYYPVVLYMYRAMGRDYQSNKIMPGLEMGGSGASKVVERYPAGMQVIVYYNPQNPADAVLEKKASATIWLWVALVIMDFMLLGIVVPLLIFFN